MGSHDGDVAIVGAGLIGLATAFELASIGTRVRVFDRGEPGRAASWAGAGMLAPFTEKFTDGALREWCIESLELYPDFVARVRDASGVHPYLQLDGIINAFFDDVQGAAAMHRAGELKASGVNCEILDRAATLASEPFI